MGTSPAAAIEIPGSWPECYEADSRLARLGPAETPSCVLSAGYTSGWLSGTLDADILAIEHTCMASGAACCGFHAREVEAWRAMPDAKVHEWLTRIDFGRFREAASRRRPVPRFRELPPEPAAAPQFDADAPVVHVWGPVMVLPYTGPDDALRTLETLARDPGIGAVRAVVIDLRDAVLDEGFAALALEQLIESIEAWGAEPILSRVSSLSEGVVRGIESARLLLRKDLPDAIAAAFQIAEAQRRTA
jgi:hypothetical protein